MRLNKTLKLKFMLMFFGQCLSNTSLRHLDTMTKYTVYPLSYWWKDYSNSPGSYFATLSYVQQNLAQICLPFYFLRNDIRSSSFLKILRFYPVLPIARFKQLLFGGSYSKNPKKFENVRLWTSIFRYANLKIVPLITSELFNRNLSIVCPTLFFNFVIVPK